MNKYKASLGYVVSQGLLHTHTYTAHSQGCRLRPCFKTHPELTQTKRVKSLERTGKASGSEHHTFSKAVSLVCGQSHQKCVQIKADLGYSGISHVPSVMSTLFSLVSPNSYSCLSLLIRVRVSSARRRTLSLVVTGIQKTTESSGRWSLKKKNRAEGTTEN